MENCDTARRRSTTGPLHGHGPELDDLWQYEVRLWHDRLLWDVSGAFAALRRIVGRGGLPGKAVRVHDRTVGYTYYGIDGHLG